SQLAIIRYSSIVLRHFFIRRFVESGRLSCAFRIRNSVSWILNLLADRCEYPRYPSQTDTIGNERWDKSTSVGVYEIRGASFDRTVGLKQPFAFADFYAHDTFLFRRSEFIRWRPMTHENKPISSGP